MNVHTLRHALLPLTLAATLSGCQGVIDAPTDRPDAALRRMQTCDQLHTRVTETVLEQLVSQQYGWGRGVALEDDVAADSGSESGGGAPTDYTTTNVQEQGVDEVDLVKTNGTHLFIAEDQAVQIVKSWPVEDSELLAQVDLGGWARGLFLVDDTLVVFSWVDPWSDRDGNEGDAWFRGYEMTRVTVIDVSDPTAPVVQRTRDFEGGMVDGRMVDGEVYMVMRDYLDLDWEMWDKLWQAAQPYQENYPYDGTEAERTAYQAKVRAELRPTVERLMSEVSPSDFMPRFADIEDGVAGTPEQLVACDEVYAADALSPLSMLSVVHIDLDDTDISTTSVLADGWQVYASKQRMYVAQSSRWWWGWEEEGVSQIHAFELHADGPPTYEASGEVDGWLYDQFAMSEYDGHLRVVTSDFQMWWGWGEEAPTDEPANNIFVLKDDGAGTLQQVGHVGRIAPGETIQSARMMGDKGYLVTFEQIDPLFTLDLSEPTDPRVVGELKIPGFSAYLHPVGDDHLLAIGMDGLDTGELTGLAINLFDVSNPAKPTLAHQLTLGSDEGWAWSEALWDHHAFTYHRDTLTIPAYTEHYDAVEQRWTGFSGSISFHATPTDGITELGRVDHRDLISESECLYSRWYGWEDACGWDGGYWYARVRRSVYIEDNLFTISDYGVKVNDLADPSDEIARVVFYPAD